MMRPDALEAVGGYRDDLIAGEEPELCVRLRAAGWRIWRLEREMAIHDAAHDCILTSGGGAPYAVATPTRKAPICTEHRPNATSFGRHAVLGFGEFGCRLPAFSSIPLFGAWGWALWLIYPLQFFRQTMRNRGPLGERALLALFQVLSRFAEGLGQISFFRDRVFGRQGRLIEYK